jgi:hypothetical protein
MYSPLQFWFQRNNGLALPPMALQYHDVRVTLKFREANACVNYEGPIPPSLVNLMADSYLLIDYVYLDSEERKRFAQASHEYLIEQLQFTGSESLTSSSNKYRLNFNHPSKYLVWAPHLERHMNRNQYLAYAFNGDWNVARERFAKAIVAATGTLAAGLLSFGSLTTEVGELITPPLPPGGLLSKVEVKFVAKDTSGRVDATNLNSLLENAIVTRNDLTMEDISSTVQALNAAVVGAPVSPAVFDLFGINVVNYHNYGNFIDGTDNPVISSKLQLNGHDRFQARDGHYFNYVQPAQHFSNTPADGVNVYSFALRAEDHQPTGTCNFSRIDNATLQVDCGLYNAASNTYAAQYIGSSSNSIVNIYTVNYNVLRVMSGMAGTAYSN